MSFRREPKIPRGGPDGGNGGRGGRVVLVADQQVTDLSRFRHAVHHRGRQRRPRPGQGAATGRPAPTCAVAVPPGTRVIRDGHPIAELAHAGRARGGGPGRRRRRRQPGLQVVHPPGAAHHDPRRRRARRPGSPSSCGCRWTSPWWACPTAARARCWRPSPGPPPWSPPTRTPPWSRPSGRWRTPTATSTSSPTCPASPPTAPRGATPTWSSWSGRGCSLHCVDASDPEPAADRIERARAGAVRASCPRASRELVVATHADAAEEPPDGADLGVDTETGAGVEDAAPAGHLPSSPPDGGARGEARVVDPGRRARATCATRCWRRACATWCGVRRQGHHPVLVTSGAIACGLGRLGISERPTAPARPAGRVGGGAGGALPALLRGLRAPRRGARPGAAHLQRPGGPRLLPQRPHHPAPPARARARSRSINENDTTATDEVTFGDNDVLAAQVAILLGAAWLVLLTDREGLYAPGPDGPRAAGRRPRRHAARTRSRLADMAGSGLGRGRHRQQGGRREHGDRAAGSPA